MIRIGRSEYGWKPPPRPLNAPPSFEPSDDDKTTKWKILLDWWHDDDLYDVINGIDHKFLGEMGVAVGNPHPVTDLPVERLIAFYMCGPNPTPDAIAALTIATQGDFGAFSGECVPNCQTVTVPGYGTQTTPFTVQAITSLPDWLVQIWHNIDDALSKAQSKRTALGPLPPNEFQDDSGNLKDPVTINYYDDKWIKRIHYPAASISLAVRPDNDRWWNVGSGATQPTIEQLQDQNGNPTTASDPNGSFQGEGWDFAQGSGTLDDILHVVVAVLAVVVNMIPGIGQIVSAEIVLLAVIAVDIVQAIEQSFWGGNAAGAMLNIGQAILNFDTAAIGQMSGVSASIKKLGLTGMRLLGHTLTQLGKDYDPTYHPDLKTALEELKAKAAQYGPMDEGRFEAVLATIGTGSEIAQEGWRLAQYLPTADLAGLSKVYGLQAAAAQGLFNMGVQLGTLARQQRTTPPWSILTAATIQDLKSVGGGLVLTFQEFATADLMNYVKTILVPRYDL